MEFPNWVYSSVSTGHPNADSSPLGTENIHLVSLLHRYKAYPLPDWMNHKQESRLPGEISTTSDMQMIPF